MAYFFQEPSHTFSEYLLVPGYSAEHCIPANVSLKTPVVRFKKGEECPLTMNVPMVSAVMQAVSGEQMGIALAKEGVDSYVPYAGALADGMATTLAKVRSTMCNCGALTIPELREKAKLTLVSATSIVEGGAHDVLLKDTTNGNQRG